jgi:uncharacterized membrane protein
MGRNLAWSLLAVSVALNVFFAGGVIYSKVTAERLRASPAERAQFLAERFGLSDQQHDRLLAFQTAMGERRGALREGFREARAALLAELAKPELDRERIARLRQEQTAVRSALFEDFAGELHQFLATLSPEQKADFVAMLEERGLFRGLFGRPNRR